VAQCVGIEAAAAKNSVTMRALALSIAKANTRAGKIKAGIKVGAVYGTAEALLTEPLFYHMAQLFSLGVSFSTLSDFSTLVS
jgi:hypothetical protein